MTEPIDLSDDITVLHGPTPASPEVVAALVERLEADPTLDAAGPLDPVVDAVKQIGPDGIVVSGVDRALLGHLGRPLAVRRRALGAADGEPEVARLGLV